MKNRSISLFLLQLATVAACCHTTREPAKCDQPATKESEPQAAVSPAPVEPAVITSVPAIVTDSYPDQVRPQLYRVVSGSLAVRDFPSMHAKQTGALRRGTEVVGYEIEGDWVRIEENSYISIHHIRPVSPTLAAGKHGDLR